MKTKLMLIAAGSTLALMTLAGCSSSPASSSGGASDSSPSPSASHASAASDDLAIASTSLGDVVVDGKGMTAYYYDRDVADSGSSTCTGGCASAWPAITTTSDKPTVKGVTGTVGTITGVGGGTQITIDGRPIYTFANDKAAGDVAGQGVGGVWYVISANGDELKTAAKSGY